MGSDSVRKYLSIIGIKRDNRMKLYVPIPSLLKFQPIFDESEWLQKVLTQDTRTMSVWYIEDGCDMDELKRILVGNNINYRIKK